MKFWQKEKRECEANSKESEEIVSEIVNEKNENDTLTFTENITEDFTENALSCFGWKKDTTEKWLIKCAKVWFLVLSFLYFAFGALTFAPIIFISKKIYPLVKDKKKSIICAIIIYGVIVCLIAILIGIRHTPETIPTTTPS